MKNTSQVSQTGFSLIELTVVLFIVGLLLGGMLKPLSTQIEIKERKSTQDQLEETIEAIYGFALQNGRLPCPDTDLDGTENRVSFDICSGDEGGIPSDELGVDPLDAWGHRILYRVSADHADAPDTDDTGCGASANGLVSFELCSDGNITIKGAGGVNNIATKIPAILVSKGKYRWRPSDASADENENFEQHDIDGTTEAVPMDTLSTFVMHDYADNFDDIVSWISPHILRNKMLNAGKLP